MAETFHAVVVFEQSHKPWAASAMPSEFQPVSAQVPSAVLLSCCSPYVLCAHCSSAAALLEGRVDFAVARDLTSSLSSR
jgi:hypothetical protein